MSQAVLVELELPDDWGSLAFPKALDERLQELLDRQDSGEPLTDKERSEAEGLVSLAEMVSLLRLRAERAA